MIRTLVRLGMMDDPLRQRSGYGNAKTAGAPNEHNEQAAFLDWLYQVHSNVRQHTAAIPNGTHKKSIPARMKHKREGLTPGYPDLLIDYPAGPYHGLRIEMKRRARSLSTVHDTQYLWQDRLRRQGYRSVICYGAEEAIAETTQYLAQGPFDIVAYVRAWYEDDNQRALLLHYLEEERA